MDPNWFSISNLATDGEALLGNISEHWLEGHWALYMLIIRYVILHKALNLSRLHFPYLKLSLDKLIFNLFYDFFFFFNFAIESRQIWVQI